MTDSDLQKALKVIKHAETKGIQKDEVFEFLLEKELNEEQINKLYNKQFLGTFTANLFYCCLLILSVAIKCFFYVHKRAKMERR